MRLRGKIARVAVFLVVVGLIVVGSAAGPYLAVGGSPPEAVEYSEYDPAELVPERAESEGVPAVERREGGGLVLIDEQHLNRFTRDEIQPLTDAITAAGYRIEFVEGTDDMDAALSRADALVVIDPGEAYSADEAERVGTFVDRGGRLLMLGEPTTLRIEGTGFGARIVDARNRLSSLSSQFGIEFGSNYLYNMEENDGNFENVIATAEAEDSLTEGVDRTAFYAAAHVEVSGATRLLVGTDGTRNSRGDTAGEHAIAARTRNVVAIGDTSFLERGNYNVLDNDALVGNLAAFLTGGDRERTLLDYPAVVDANPTIKYTSPALLDAAQAVGNDLSGPNRGTSLTLDGDDLGDADVLVTTHETLRTSDVEGTGITFEGDRVSVPGYTSISTGVIVIRAPAGGELDLVIAADTAARAEDAATLLTSGRFEEHTISDRTAVLRTFAAVTPTEAPAGNETV